MDIITKARIEYPDNSYAPFTPTPDSIRLALEYEYSKPHDCQPGRVMVTIDGVDFEVVSIN